MLSRMIWASLWNASKIYSSKSYNIDFNHKYIFFSFKTDQDPILILVISLTASLFLPKAAVLLALSLFLLLRVGISFLNRRFSKFVTAEARVASV